MRRLSVALGFLVGCNATDTGSGLSLSLESPTGATMFEAVALAECTLLKAETEAAERAIRIAVNAPEFFASHGLTDPHGLLMVHLEEDGEGFVRSPPRITGRAMDLYHRVRGCEFSGELAGRANCEVVMPDAHTLDVSFHWNCADWTEGSGLVAAADVLD